MNGVVYTPAKLADYLAYKAIAFLLEDHSCHEPNAFCEERSPVMQGCFKILDPACGEGELLISAWHQLWRQLQHQRKNSIVKDDGFGAQNVLCGIDIDPIAVQRTKKRIEGLNIKGVAHGKLNVLCANSLFPSRNKTSEHGWYQIRQEFNSQHGFDLIIANPPWGADVRAYRRDLDFGEFELYQGQYDTSDLFLELSLRVLKPLGYLAFIVPDSLFSQERVALRKLLLEQTEIRFIGRMGERIFEKINRACVLIICKKKSNRPDTPPAPGLTQCLRLTPVTRKEIMRGEMGFPEAEKLLMHYVPQRRFLNNKDYRFDIDLVSKEERTLRSIGAVKGRFGDFLQSGRGIELSKTGKIYQCNRCALWLPFPTGLKPSCPHCKTDLSILPKRIDRIVNSEHRDGREALLVGESIQRYKIQSKLWIETERVGINYKDERTYEAPKLLVRKTGVGISAAIDYSRSYTNQVVYIFRPRRDVDTSIPLELFLAMLNSRAIYYYVVKSHGETEWRSHPYLTQKQILDLPSPNVHALYNGNSNLVLELVELLEPYTRKNLGLPDEVDARIERFVAQLYGLNKRHYQTIYKAIDGAQELLPVRNLKRISVADIFG